MLVVVFYSLWSTSSTLLLAINRHEHLAAIYTLATGITCGICYLAARRFGLYGAAASLLVSEAVMNLYVLPASLRIADDSFGPFLACMAHWPKSLNWEAMASRLRRSKPELES